MTARASEVRSVIITGQSGDGVHVLQYTRLTLQDAEWLQSMDGHFMARSVDTDHVQHSMDLSAAQGDRIVTFDD